VPEQNAHHPETLGLSTKLEEDFISPLTAIRGALEIMNDFPDLPGEQRLRFVRQALSECKRLEMGVNDLAVSVYAAGRRDKGPASPKAGAYADRIQTFSDQEIMELDFSDLAFVSAQMVDEVFDAIDAAIRQSGRAWWLLVNFKRCVIWPEAWVAYAHRTKKVAVNHALGSVRYAELDPKQDGHAAAPETAERSDILPSRDAALAQIDAMRAVRPSK
jgi:hypothetical protein